MTTPTTSLPLLRRPNWARNVDFGLLLTLALCAFALWPLLYRPGLPNGNDVLYHVYRTAEMDRAWARGVLLPRWAESFYTGYGAPVFHYYASLSYYAASLFMRLFGLDALNSLRLLIAVCVLGAGAGTYLFVKRRAGMLGGVIAALCYVYSPYMLFTEPYSRGAYPELAALALFPFVIWRFDTLLQPLKIRHVILAALALAALILTHNLMGLVMTGLLAAWLVWETVARLLTVGRGGIQPYLVALLTAALGIGLAAYFWLPVILESEAVRLGNLTAVAQLDYRNFFVPLSKLLAFSPRFDGGALNGLQHQFNLGVPQWLLTLTGLLGLGFIFIQKRRFLTMEARRTQRKNQENRDLSAKQSSALGTGNSEPGTPLSPQSLVLSPFFFVLAGVGFILLMLPLAEPVWSPLAFLQFPWRFLGPAGFCLAVVAGMNTIWIERLPKRAAAVLAAAVVIFIVGLALPLFYISEWTHPTVDASVAAYQQAEVQGLQRATTFSNEYLPQTVQVEPDATDSLLADYADGYPVNHLNLETLPEGVTASLQDNGPQHSQWQVQAEAPFTMEVLIFDFLGWKAEIDGQPVPITPSDPHGLITFPVPAGDHTVRVYLGSTPARDLGVAITLFSMVGVVGLAALVYFAVQRQRLKPSGYQEDKPTKGAENAVQPFLLSPQSSVLSPSLGTRNSELGTIFALITAFVVILVLAFVYLREGVGWVESPPGQALLAQHQIVYHLGDSIDLLGYDLSGDNFRPEDRVELSVYWYARAPIPYGYASFVHISTGGPPLAQADKQNPAGRPTKEWTSDGYIRDDYTIQLPNDMPAGEYTVYIGLYTCDTLPAGECGNGERLTVTDADDQPIGDALPLQTITVQ